MFREKKLDVFSVEISTKLLKKSKLRAEEARGVKSNHIIGIANRLLVKISAIHFVR